MKESKIVVNDSKGYGYNYASLGDIANQGFKIPKMKTGTENEKEYVYYFDSELKEWIRGAEIVIPENIVNSSGKNKMNAAQLYGSALTYARRYTTLMALQLACDDDKNLESSPEEIKQKMITDGQKKMIINNYKLVIDELKANGIKSNDQLNSLTIDRASELCKLISERLDNGTDN